MSEKKGEMIQTQEIWEQGQKLQNWLVQVRRDFHRYPELSTQEFQTRDRIINYLQEMGLEVQTDFPNLGVVGIINGTAKSQSNDDQVKEAEAVALRADMDALPLEDAKSVPYKSQNPGVTHACGHDAHITILLGAASILTQIRHKFSGQIKLIFQPAEETVGGAKPMIDAGVLEKPKVKSIFGLHVAPDLPLGTIGVKYDQMNASSDTISIKIKGKRGHGAYPHESRDAITASAQVISALQTITSRNVNPLKSAVISLGTIQGGTQHNVIAGEVAMTGTVRTLDPETRQYVLSRVKTTVEAITQGLDTKGEVFIEEGYPPLINDEIMTNLVLSKGKELLGDENVRVETSPTMGVEDFSYFLEQSSGTFYKLGCANKDQNEVYPIHNEFFDINEDCLSVGTVLQALNAITALQSSQN
ncbi:M20 metallopeptidase family protein [Natranaerobius thermophilus]|uniref:Amidohydrolase n=1 Tax=Natranaerobius thermophilus (strain ATCC BAA-1301 / DSM 18059 / JW/NM-WN-LF) TaxID=457570 RepID=B2A290_NATTJ|nr:amidohydrolase [Natranaerobius thermophilus]ACB86262.1 amidohydrolase [Natranaerobius thermophilus JW/NM-WN-LF]